MWRVRYSLSRWSVDYEYDFVMVSLYFSAGDSKANTNAKLVLAEKKVKERNLGNEKRKLRPTEANQDSIQKDENN